MLMLKVLPILAYGAAVGFIAVVATRERFGGARAWVLPSVLGVLFLIFSLITMANGGLWPFWYNHSTNFAGNQVWFDLLIAVSIGFYLIAPRARAMGMPLLPWAIAVLATACVALLPMLARLLWLEHKAAQ